VKMMPSPSIEQTPSAHHGCGPDEKHLKRHERRFSDARDMSALFDAVVAPARIGDDRQEKICGCPQAATDGIAATFGLGWR